MTSSHNSENTTPVETSRRNALRAAIAGSGVAVVYWKKPIIDALVLPAHAQTSVLAPLSVAVTVAGPTGVSGTVEGANPGETVAIVVAEAASGKFVNDTTNNADKSGRAAFNINASKLAKAGMTLRDGANVKVTARTKSGASGTKTKKVGSDATDISVILTSADATAGVKGSLSGAKSGDTVALTVTESGRAYRKTMKVNGAGRIGLSISAAELKKSGLALKAGSKLQVQALAKSGRTGMASRTITGAATKLSASMTADLTKGIIGSVTGAKAGESVTINLAEIGTGAMLAVKANADGTGRASFVATADALKVSGFSMKSGSDISANIKSASGRSGSTSAKFTGAVSSTLSVSMAVSTSKGVEGSMTGAVAGESVAVTLSESSTGAKLSLKTKADISGRAALAATADKLKTAGFSMKAGSVVSASALSASGRKGSASASFTSSSTSRI